MAEKLIPFAIKAITTEQFATNDDCYNKKEEVEIETSFNFGIDKEEAGLAVKFGLSFHCDKGAFIILKITVEFDIEKETFETFQNKKTKQYKVSKSFFTHLSVITVGTARGVLHAKLENTKYSKYMLPTLDISKMLEEDLVFK